ncbi:MAG TPA: protein kinase [Syntrophomonadaceae bacterium]|nr:protein kinase [Syntrophomonadaceae bacterium]HPR93768.1 protein kinase [Syntrophomonadaceae bacterium]
MSRTLLGDRYEILEIIGEGGMAIVYKARDITLDRVVAIKVLKDEFDNDPSFVERFKIEALAAAKLSHPNIVNIYDVGQQNNKHYIVMEYVEGKTLQETISSQGLMPVTKAVDIAAMICDGLQAAHEKGIIHRDVKPHNILITNSGIVKVADFGIAQAISKKTLTFNGHIVGTVHYIAPEQAKGETVTPATDIYSLGCVLYEMLTGIVPFDAESPLTVVLKHIHDEPVLPRSKNPAIPAGLENVILKSLEKNPALRFKSAEEMRTALINFHSNAYSNYNRNNINGRTIMIPPIEDDGGGTSVAKKKLRPAGIAIITIAILGFLVGMFFQLGGNIFGQEVVVPDIEGMAIQEANDELDKVNLSMTVVDKQNNDEVEADHIISQQPASGQKVKEGREIEVILSLGSELHTVPSLVGLTLSEAEIALRNEGFSKGAFEGVFDDRFAEDLVISQDPTAGSEAAEGSKINIMYSKGKTPERITMPSLIGLSLAEAKNILAENNLELGTANKQDSSEYFEGQVTSQDTEAGVLIDEESIVNLTVSKGPGPSASSKNLEFQLPDELDYYKVVIKLKDSKGQREVYNQLHHAADTVNVGVSYFGKASVDIQLNGNHYKTINL